MLTGARTLATLVVVTLIVVVVGGCRPAVKPSWRCRPPSG